MGKKARLKRERRAAAMPELLRLLMNDTKSTRARDDGFRDQSQALKKLFIEFDPADVVVSLGVSELWLPNRSSQVKHVFAFQVALSMPTAEYSGARRIDSFEAFREFTHELHQLLPPNPMLEDFVPEADWGEIMLPTDGRIEPIFYGGSVERIPDFIEAFRLLRADEPQALADMRLALALQAHIIRSIPASVVGNADRVRAGHIEIPTAEFWVACRQTLLSTYSAVQPVAAAASAAMTIELGALRAPITWGSFGDGVMSGTALPHCIVQIGQTRIPISPRSASAVVIDFWDARPRNVSVDFYRRLGLFLTHRLRQGSVVAGPMKVVGTSEELGGPFVAVVSSGRKFHFIVAVAPDELPRVASLERKLRRLIDSNDRWGLALPDIREVVEFRHPDGLQPRSADVQVLAVLACATTKFSSFELPTPTVRVLGSPDFVSIFDSLKNAKELDKYWDYIDQTKGLVGGFSGATDHFASFRDSHALLVDGAISPNFISLDPHWNSSWRFNELKTFWESAPARFPDDRTTWVVDEMSDGLTTLQAKGPLALVWSGTAGSATFQAQIEIDDDEPDMENGPVLELFVHCVVDAITQRGDLLSRLPLFQREHIVVHCRFNEHALVSLSERSLMEERAGLPLLSSWSLEAGRGGQRVDASVEVNLARLHVRMEKAKDASCEVECATEMVLGLSELLGLSVDEEVMSQLQETATRLPRFTTHTTQRRVDVPNYADPSVPEGEHYKRARRDLAVVLKNRGVSAPARYELVAAKVIMNAARDAARQEIHAQVARLDRRRLLLFCIEQHDKLTAKYSAEVTRMKLSLTHEVSFDRSARLAEAYEAFTSSARNYRYLLECCLSLPGPGGSDFRSAEAVQLIAAVDWLSVLYGASDTLHNDIDVGGIELNDAYVPTVYFSEGRDERERDFFQEAASAKIGIGLAAQDEVNSAQGSSGAWEGIDTALVAEVGFSLTHLLQTLNILSRWFSVGGSPELEFCYSATPQALNEALVRHVPDLTPELAGKLIEFLTLEPAGVRRLAGKDVDEPDVPVWEHNKRVHRYLIRPLIRVDADTLAWGAATVNRVSAIWAGSIFDGYLPADLPWPHMVKAVRTVKEGIERGLEVRAFEVTSRVTPYAMSSLDLRRRFPKEAFEDVGDYDVLAYWPEHSLWLSIECKYNQPPFCLKDARRLRDRIFGPGDGRWHMQKIERRRLYLADNVERVRQLLQWPEGQAGEPRFREVYACRDIYWSMRDPPYPVSSEFVRIDGLEAWLRAMIDAIHEAGPTQGPAAAIPAN